MLLLIDTVNEEDIDDSEKQFELENRYLFIFPLLYFSLFLPECFEILSLSGSRQDQNLYQNSIRNLGALNSGVFRNNF